MRSRGTSARRQPSLAAVDSIHWKRVRNLPIGFFQRDFGVGAKEAGDVHGGEEEIADFFFKVCTYSYDGGR